jgi:hypothetical protein
LDDSLDGMQAPGSPDRKPGRSHPRRIRARRMGLRYQDEVMLAEMGKGFGTTELLFGRRTYEEFF